MKTEDLVTLLASGAGPVQQHVFARRYGAAAALGLAAALALMLAWLGLNPVLADYLRLPMFWAKAA
ncbi:MAG: NrsF family protein, partial [Rhodocyclaceae bacterium]